MGFYDASWQETGLGGLVYSMQCMRAECRIVRRCTVSPLGLRRVLTSGGNHPVPRGKRGRSCEIHTHLGDLSGH